MDPAPTTLLAAGPLPTRQQDHVHVQEEHGQRHEVKDARPGMTPVPKSRNCDGTDRSSSCCRTPRPVGEPSIPINTGTAQSSAPRMKATVTFAVKSDATMPTARSIAPISQ